MCVYVYGCGERGECLWGYNYLRIYPRLIKANLFHTIPALRWQKWGSSERGEIDSLPREEPALARRGFQHLCFILGGGGRRVKGGWRFNTGKHEGSESRTGIPGFGVSFGAERQFEPLRPRGGGGRPSSAQRCNAGCGISALGGGGERPLPPRCPLRTHSSFPAPVQNTSPRSLLFARRRTAFCSKIYIYIHTHISQIKLN